MQHETNAPTTPNREFTDDNEKDAAVNARCDQLIEIIFAAEGSDAAHEAMDVTPAKDELCRLIMPYLARATSRYAAQPDDHKEHIQNAIEKILSNLGMYKRGNFIAWSSLVARNRSLDTVRHNNRRPDKFSLDENSPHGDPSGYRDMATPSAEAAALELSFGQIIELLRNTTINPDFLSALALRASGLSYDEIAAKHGIPRETVGTRILRARKKLRLELEDPKSPLRAELGSAAEYYARKN
jgi:RNA polymerase sigma-70 factor (ECF subfamily)